MHETKVRKFETSILDTRSPRCLACGQERPRCARYLPSSSHYTYLDVLRLVTVLALEDTPGDSQPAFVDSFSACLSAAAG
jgi:hypothetical protein